MDTFKDYLKKLKKKKKKQKMLGTLTPVRRDPSTMPNTAMLPAGTGGNQPRLS
jgi:hypothetical protein